MPIYHIDHASLRKALEALGLKSVTELCSYHIAVTGFPLCKPKTIYSQLSEAGYLSMTLSRAIYSLTEIVKLKHENESLKGRII